MKKILFLALIAFGIKAKGQIVYEHTYDTASTAGMGPYSDESQLMIINFEISGERYVKINRWGKVIDIYDLNHSLVKTISIANVPLRTNNQVGEILYLSENLFNTDSKMEFMYILAGFNSFTTYIYKEDGSIMFSDTGAELIKVNYEQQQMPIYNTSAETKMILSYSSVSGVWKVFGLPGKLTTGIQEGNSQLMRAQGMISNPYPNPATSSTRIDYNFPNGVNEGEIIFYDLQGKEIKRFKVDKTFDHLLISTADIPAGTYFYQLQCNSQFSEGKKMVVIK